MRHRDAEGSLGDDGGPHPDADLRPLDADRSHVPAGDPHRGGAAVTSKTAVLTPVREALTEVRAILTGVTV